MENGLTKDEANNIAKTIELMKAQSIICEKCEKAECCCKIGEKGCIHSELAFRLPIDDEYEEDDSDITACDFCNNIHCAGGCLDEY